MGKYENIKNYNVKKNMDVLTPYGKGMEPDVDFRTDYGKGLVPDIDSKTDFGKGISFKSVDGREWAEMEQAEAANRAFYESLIIKSQNNNEEEPKHHR